jgi:GNAT superfamily N-acetyltransferase
MVPLRMKAPDWVRKAEEAPHRSMAFRHATLHRRPGLWGDHPERPTSAVWLREGDRGEWEAFGAGRPEPAVGWLAARAGGRPVALLAPLSWEGPVRMLGGRVEAGTNQTRLLPKSSNWQATPTRVKVRRLTPDDGIAFEADAPAWALRSWGDFATMVSRGDAFGVPAAGGFASLAWTYESDLEHDKIGVFTVARFRNLGLGRTAASALVGHIIEVRRRSPLWVTTSDNLASIALARSLGFSGRVDETLLRWSPGSEYPPVFVGWVE